MVFPQPCSCAKIFFLRIDDDITTQELIDNLQRQVDRMEIKLRHKRNSSRDLEKLLETPKPNGSYTVVGMYTFNLRQLVSSADNFCKQFGPRPHTQLWVCILFIFAYKCHLLITFANSLDPDQARHNVGPDLDPNCNTL